MFTFRLNWAGPFALGALFDLDSEFTRFFPDFEYLIYDLSTIQDENIRGAAKTRMTLLLQKCINDDGLPAKLSELADISAELAADWSRDNYLRTVGQYLLDTDKLTMKELDDFLDKAYAGRRGGVLPTNAGPGCPPPSTTSLCYPVRISYFAVFPRSCRGRSPCPRPVKFLPKSK
ncbi:MAG: Rpn family recombination-promoting nuclease/putative transposase [Deltaproteobacteria bacterium]|nr:Rpn family recombination-promoting nuclease/putative transposase [Deltaproteobacteria bacterium]